MSRGFVIVYNLVLISLLALGISCLVFPDNQFVAFTLLVVLFSTWPILVLGTWTFWIYRKVLWGKR